jgi:methylphosphotriester-DNA--protein-cysteine methyltransferase
MRRTWILLGPDRRPLESVRPGTLGGHRGTRIFGRLDCPVALRAIERGGYVRQRVFSLNRTHARAAGYRPCAACLPKEYAAWKSTGKS